MRVFNTFFVAAVCLLAALAVAQDQTSKDQTSHKATAKNAGLSDAQYMAKALTAAPPGVAKDAGVARIDKDGNMKSLRASKNGFTCLLILNDIMCSDANSMAFFDATAKKQTPPDKLGLSYMLRGDQGASNTDPSASGKTADNHWVVTGPHIMIVGAAVKDLGLPDSPDADPSKPYLMWAGTPYAHAMIPVGGGAAHSAAAKPPLDK
ncbi:MAG TPA: hypothetical protein VEN79_12785 [Terriglobia bacterium]|nr:hypothetical protein [Terriglobia bacterium]